MKRLAVVLAMIMMVGCASQEFRQDAKQWRKIDNEQLDRDYTNRFNGACSKWVCHTYGQRTDQGICTEKELDFIHAYPGSHVDCRNGWADWLDRNKRIKMRDWQVVSIEEVVK